MVLGSSRRAVLNLWVATIRKHMFLIVLRTETPLSNNYEVATKISLRLGVPKTIGNMYFPMVMTHRLRTSVLEYTKCGMLTGMGIHLYRPGGVIIHGWMRFSVTWLFEDHNK